MSNLFIELTDEDDDKFLISVAHIKRVRAIDHNVDSYPSETNTVIYFTEDNESIDDIFSARETYKEVKHLIEKAGCCVAALNPIPGVVRKKP